MSRVILGGMRGGKMAILMRLLKEAMKQGKTTAMVTANYVWFEDREKELRWQQRGSKQAKH